ncbi:MAG: alpha-amylase family glycosyl hydrolase [Flammeovirgaceae bacterium]
MRKVLSVVIVYFVCMNFGAFAQSELEIQKVEPAFWWTGMKNKSLQVMFYGNNLAGSKVKVMGDQAKVQRIESLSNPNYLFVYLEIAASAQAGNFKLVLEKDGKQKEVSYELKQKSAKDWKTTSINSSDLIYLITPDRFANGDTKNDQITGMKEQTNRADSKARHGGDLRGIINNLDYISNLGMTALWLNPPQENDQNYPSYHGYGITDFYLTDRRFGSNEEYLELVDKAHQKGLKIVMDQIFNHCGLGHWWMDDLPADDWINSKEKYGYSLFHNATAADPYASKHDLDRHQKGWFDDSLPDLNLDNPQLQTYLAQNAIWWVEYLQLDGIRIDTYPYPNGTFMTYLARYIQEEYPGLFVTGEVWVGEVAIEAFWNNATVNKDGRHGHLHSITDFPMYFAAVDAFKNKNLMAIANVLAQDHVYGSPNENVIFLDNHDVNRFYADINQDLDLWKLATVFLMTTRGVPQWYYGSEILMKGTKPDWIIREDMPGGWASDTKNAFTGKGLSNSEKDAMSFVSKVANWRKNAVAVHQGELLHFVPQDDVYVYFRVHAEQTVMVILNAGKAKSEVDWSRFAEVLSNFKSGKDVISGKHFAFDKEAGLAAKTAYVIELEK